MKKFIMVLIAIFCLTVSAYGVDIKLAWDANTEPDLAGYKIYWSEENTQPFPNVKDVGNVLEHPVTGLTEGVTYYFAATAYDTNGNESMYSNIVQFVAEPGTVIIRILSHPKNIRMIFE